MAQEHVLAGEEQVTAAQSKHEEEKHTGIRKDKIQQEARPKSKKIVLVCAW